MENKSFLPHRYIPNTAPGVREEVLREIGVDSVDEIYLEIPEDMRFIEDLNIPKEQQSELQVAKKITEILSANKSTEDLLSFLGGGIYPHYSPALCSEIAGRSEFLTAYAGGDATDHGRYQAMFEYQSMMGDLLEMDVVSAPVYDGTTASGDALHIVSRATGRREVLIPKTLSPNTKATMENYGDPWVDLKTVKHDPETGMMDLDDLKEKISEDTAAVFIENPGYLGFIESQCHEISQIAHENGALLVAYVNPVSLGLLAPPGEYGADIACGEGQPLGMPLSCGGATLGILAVNDADRFLTLMPSFLVGISNTVVPGERAFSWHTLWDRMVYSTREKAKSFTGTSSWLWGIAAAVYMSLMGPHGMRELAEINMQNAHYASELLGEIDGLETPVFSSTHFNEFLVRFDKTGKSVEEINKALFENGILGGKDLSLDFPNLGQTALYCVTEVHSQNDIEVLVETLEKSV